MAACDVWDVVKVPFPYTNRPVQQHRPALVVARHSRPGSPQLLWVLMVTRADHRSWPGDVAVSDMAAAGLPVASIIRTAKIATVEAGSAETIGAVAAPDRGRVRSEIATTLAKALRSGARGSAAVSS